MTTTPATPRTRAQLHPIPEALQAVLSELRKDQDRSAQLSKALWSVYHLTEQLLTQHMPCSTPQCPTCYHLADCLTVFHAVSALWANDIGNDTDQKGGAT